MAKLTQAQLKEKAKLEIFKDFKELLGDAYQTDKFTYALPAYVEDKEIWVEIKFTAKALDFDVQYAEDSFKFEQEQQRLKAEKRKAEKEAKKQKDLERKKKLAEKKMALEEQKGV